MEIIINNEILKNAVNRIANIILKKSYIPALQGFKIVANGDLVTIQATNMESYVTLRIADVTIIKDGEIVIDISDMEKILMVKGMIRITVNEKNIINAKSEKKKTTVCGISVKEYPEFPTVEQTENSLAMIIPNANSFCSDLKILGISKSLVESKPMYTGFNFNSTNNSICTLDGYRMTVRKVDWFTEKSTNITVRGMIDKELAKIVGKDKNEIKVYHSERYAAFVGSDFTYIVELLVGNFLDWKEMMPNEDVQSEFSFADTKAFLDTLKEYDKFTDKKNKTPCVITGYSSNNILTDFRNGRYNTTDEVNVNGNFSKDTFIGVNSKYLYEALSLYYKEDIDYTVKIYNSITPIVITGGDWISLVVPVKVQCEDDRKNLIVKEYAA